MEERVQWLSAVFGGKVVEQGLRRLEQVAKEVWNFVRLNEDQLFFQMSVRLSDQDMSPFLEAYVRDTVGLNRGTSPVAYQKCWECPDGSLVHAHFVGYVQSACATPDNKRVVYGSVSGSMRVWDFESRQTVGGRMAGHTKGVACLAISDDGLYVVSGSRDNTVRRWQLDSGDPSGVLSKVTAVRFVVLQ